MQTKVIGEVRLEQLVSPAINDLLLGKKHSKKSENEKLNITALDIFCLFLVCKLMHGTSKLMNK